MSHLQASGELFCFSAGKQRLGAETQICGKINMSCRMHFPQKQYKIGAERKCINKRSVKEGAKCLSILEC